jgi:hypothetical protein
VTLAYLDPGSGSLIASAVVGGVAAAGVAARQARARFSAGFGRKRKQATEFSATSETTESAGLEVTDADAEAADEGGTEAQKTGDETTPVASDS